MLLLDRFGRGPATWFRVVGLAVAAWTVLTATGDFSAARWWVIILGFAAAALAWVAWSLRPERQRGLTSELYLMMGAGGLLTAAVSDSAASIFPFVAAVVAGVRAPTRAALSVVGFGIVTLAAGALVFSRVQAVGAAGTFAYAAGFIAAMLGGGGRRQSMLQAEQAELLLAQTQRSQEEQLRAARLEESARIAREIHDVLAHALAGLTIQLEATAALIEQGADRQALLERVRQAHELAREGLRETRVAVGALRGGRAPAQDRLNGLIEGFRASGGTVALQAEGALPDGPVGDTVLRTVQEALTNASKHAPGAPVFVQLGRTPKGLELSVRNPGSDAVARPLSATGGGYGILGMRERAELLGGTLTAGPDDEGWCVSLRLPLPPEPT